MESISECPMCGEISLKTIRKLYDEDGEQYHVYCDNCEWDEWIKPAFPSEIIGIALASTALKIFNSRGIKLTEEQWRGLEKDLRYCFAETLKHEGITEKALYNLGIGIKKWKKEVIE